MSNTSNNISKEEQQISLEGNLHDAVVSEYYDNGIMSYVFDGYVYWSDSDISANSNEYVLADGTQLSNEKIYLASDIYLNNGSSSPTTKLNPRESFTYTDLLFLPSKYYKTLGLSREYKYIVNAQTATGLFKTFIEGYLKDPSNTEYDQYRQILDFSIAISSTETKPLDPLNVLIDQFFNLDGKINIDVAVTPFNVKTENGSGQLQPDKNALLSDLSTKEAQLLNVVSTNMTPMQQYLNGTLADANNEKLVDNNGNPYVNWRKFNSLNITSTSGGNYFKVIESNPDDKIDKMVLFEDKNGLKGNNLFSQNNWAPFNVDPKVQDLTNDFRDTLEFNVPNYDNLVATGTIKEFTVLHNRFKYISSGLMSHTPGTENKNKILFDSLAAWNLSEENYMSEIKKSKTLGIGKDYVTYQTGLFQREDIIFSANGQITLNWASAAKIETCVISNWTTNFAILNPEYMDANNKKVIQPKYFLDFEPFNLWFASSFNRQPFASDINNEMVTKWLNSLNKEEFDFWMMSSTSKELEYQVVNIRGEILAEKCVVKNYQGLPAESLLDVGGYNFIIWGNGITPDFIFPVVDLSHPTPNPKKEALVYVNDISYSNVQIGYANSPVENYLVLTFNAKKDLWQSILNKINNFAVEIQMTLPNDIKAGYMATDTSNVLNASAYRIAYIPKLINSINIVTWILCAFITLLAILICIVVVKRYIDSNRNNIGVMLANGISKTKIIVSLLPFALLPAFIGGISAYLFGLFLQIPALGLFSAYWMLPTATIAFNFLSLIGAILMPFLVFAVITIVVAIWVLRTDPVKLMKVGSEFKINFFSKIVKRPFTNFGVIFRFRVSLAFNSLWRLLVLAMMCMLTMSALVFSFATFGKLSSSQQVNASTYNYNFAVELATPTTNGGPYKELDYLHDSGLSNPKSGLFNFYWNSDTSSPYKKFVKPYYNLKPESDYVSELTDGDKQFGNLFMPLANDVNGQNQDLFYLQNKFSSKLTMNYGMGVGSLTSNPWDIALALMPVNTNNLTSQAWIDVVNLMGKKVYTANKNNLEDKYWYEHNSNVNDYVDFFIASEDPVSEKTTYILNTKSILGLIATQLDPIFAHLITVAYQDPEILNIEYPIVYGGVPLYKANENSKILSDEKYSYITGPIINSNKKNAIDYSHNIKIYGIQSDSQYINLLDRNNNKINNLLFSYSNDDQVYPIIANSFAAHKYNLQVGDELSIYPNNTADRILKEINPSDFPNYDTAKFKVVGISQGTQDEEYFTTQSIANKILKMPDGENWNGMNQYSMWYDDISSKDGNFRLFNSNGQSIWPTVDNLTNHNYIDADIQRVEGEQMVNVPVGFNGVFTQNKNGGYILHSLCLYSYTGMYPPTSVYDMEQTKKVLGYGNNLAICNEISGIKDKTIFENAKEYYKDPKNASPEILAKFNESLDSMLSQLVINYGATTMFTTMNSVVDVKAMNEVYLTFINTVSVAQACVLSIIIPMSVVIVLLISSMIIGDSKKIAAMLKSLGYSDRENAMSFMSIYIPVIIFGLACAIPLAIGITLAYQSLLFTAANILIDVTINWWYYGLAIGAIVLLLSVSYGASYVALKKDRLVDQIK